MGKSVKLKIIMQKRPIGWELGKQYVLDKKIPKNPKYDKVQSKLAGKTGMTVNDVQILSSQTVAKRKSELFKRIKASTVQHLITSQRDQESIYKLADQPIFQKDPDSMTSVTYDSKHLGINAQTEFVLIDMQEKQEFLKCHIKEAINCPGTDVKRDKYPPQLIKVRNQPGKMAILYHSEEKAGTEFAKIFAEKGYQNSYLISGGLDIFALLYYDLLEGKELPPRKELPPQKTKMTKQLNPDNRRAKDAESRFDTQSKISNITSASRAGRVGSLNRKL